MLIKVPSSNAPGLSQGTYLTKWPNTTRLTTAERWNNKLPIAFCPGSRSQGQRSIKRIPKHIEGFCGKENCSFWSCWIRVGRVGEWVGLSGGWADTEWETGVDRALNASSHPLLQLHPIPSYSTDLYMYTPSIWTNRHPTSSSSSSLLLTPHKYQFDVSSMCMCCVLVICITNCHCLTTLTRVIYFSRHCFLQTIS